MSAGIVYVVYIRNHGAAEVQYSWSRSSNSLLYAQGYRCHLAGTLKASVATKESETDHSDIEKIVERYLRDINQENIQHA